MKMNFISLHLQSQKNVISIKKAMESFLVLKHFFAGTAGLLRTLPTPGQASQPLLQPALAVPTLNQGICMDDLQRHLSTSAILWFCQVFAPKNRNNSKKKKKKSERHLPPTSLVVSILSCGMRVQSIWFRSGKQGSAQTKMWLLNPRRESYWSKASLSLKCPMLILPGELFKRDAFL